MDSIFYGFLEKAEKLYGEGVLCRQNARFGEAINAFASSAECAGKALAILDEVSAGSGRPLGTEDSIHVTEALCGGRDAGCHDEMRRALMDIRSRAEASVALIREINGFVNADLMNP